MIDYADLSQWPRILFPQELFVKAIFVQGGGGKHVHASVFTCRPRLLYLMPLRGLALMLKDGPGWCTIVVGSLHSQYWGGLTWLQFWSKSTIVEFDKEGAQRTCTFWKLGNTEGMQYEAHIIATGFRSIVPGESCLKEVHVPIQSMWDKNCLWKGRHIIKSRPCSLAFPKGDLFLTWSMQCVRSASSVVLFIVIEHQGWLMKGTGRYWDLSAPVDCC